MPRPMKHSGVEWLGDIPAEWKIIKLKYLSRFMQTKYSKDDGQLNYIGLENIVGWSGAFIETDSVYDLDQSLICEDGDILFGKLRPYLAKVYLNTSKQCCSGEFAVIRIDDSMCKRFFWYQLMSHGFIFTVDSSTYGTKMPRANAEFIKNISVVIPPPDEQQRIATFLDGECARIDSVIEKTRASIVEYKKLKQAIITRAVTKGMRPARSMKDSGIEWLGDIPADWEIIKLKYISWFMQTKYSKDDGQLNYIGLENVVGWSGAFIKTDSVYDLDQSLICEAGDILFGKLRPYLAKVYLNTSKQCCSGEFAVIRIDDSMCKRFFWYQLMSHGFIFAVDSSTYGTKMPRANMEFIKNISVVIPPLEEQEEIAAYLDEKTAAIDSLVAKKNRLAEELTSLKKSLIFEYVTGKKEVPT